MAVVQVDVNVVCDGCNSSLTAKYINDTVYVAPCSKCLSFANSDGYREGKEDANAKEDGDD
jgi:hypothetical protein